MTNERFLSLKRQYDTPEMHRKIKYSLAEKQWELYEEVKILQEYAEEQGENLDFSQACEIIKMYRIAKKRRISKRTYLLNWICKKEVCYKIKTAPPHSKKTANLILL